ncbi:MAG: hypothetical protein LUG99_01025 [Lachnospiraceae bacterium]|nr:hypothetical protein [Lachnospiraceae bacterium]
MKDISQHDADVMEELRVKIQKLEYENRLLRTRLDEAGVSYADIVSGESGESMEPYDPNQGARIRTLFSHRCIQPYGVGGQRTATTGI